jgi:hypothetical protein
MRASTNCIVKVAVGSQRARATGRLNYRTA